MKLFKITILIIASLLLTSCSILYSNDGFRINSIDLISHYFTFGSPYTVNVNITPSQSVLNKTYTLDLYENGTLITNTQIRCNQTSNQTIEIPITQRQMNQATSGKSFSVKIHQ